MSEPSKKKTVKAGGRGAALGGGTHLGGAPPAHLGGGGAALGDHVLLSCAVESFVRDNNNFESSLALNAALDDMNTSSDLQTLFEVPLRHKLFAMEGALRWVLFLRVAPERAVKEGDAPFSAEIEFSPGGALDLIAQVYDVGLQEAAWDHFEPDSDEDEDEYSADGDADYPADEGA